MDISIITTISVAVLAAVSMIIVPVVSVVTADHETRDDLCAED